MAVSIVAAAPSLAAADPTATGLGRARICLTDEEIKLRSGETISLPATSVFEDRGPNEGKRGDFETWRHETKIGETYRAAFQTAAPVQLSAKAKCAEVGVVMSIGPLHTARSARADDAHLYSLSDVLDYPVPDKKPPAEIGKLIDDISVHAVLLGDVNTSVEVPKPPPEAEREELCLAGAKRLAAHVSAGVGGHSATNVQLGGVAAHSASYTCPSFVSRDSAGLYVGWDGSARPPAATRLLIATAGEFLTGASKTEILAETAACITQAMRPENSEMANREFRGVKIECTAFGRDGGAGSLDIYRRFGRAPSRAEPSVEAQAKVAEASRAFDLREAKKAAESRRFVEWYQDPSTPKEVKIFVMMASRVIALDRRCPSARSHSPLVAAWASSAGVTATDVQPGGRYFALMAMMMGAAQRDVAKTPVKDACVAAAKYDEALR